MKCLKVSTNRETHARTVKLQERFYEHGGELTDVDTLYQEVIEEDRYNAFVSFTELKRYMIDRFRGVK